MSLTREEMRSLMQQQRPARKRQLCEVAPSPPKSKRLKSLITGSPSSSPSSSPNKDPLVADSDDESMRFRTKSFYHSSRKKLNLPKSPQAENASSVLARIRGKGVEKRNQSPSADKNKRRPALSPIKNVYNGNAKRSEAKPVVNRRRARGKSLPPKAKLNQQTKLPPEPTKSVEAESDSITTPDKPRKFFKHKSPGSASKVVHKGFDLRFTPGSDRNGRSTAKNRKSPKQRSNSTGKKTQKRNPPKTQPGKWATVKNLSDDGSLRGIATEKTEPEAKSITRQTSTESNSDRKGASIDETPKRGTQKPEELRSGGKASDDSAFFQDSEFLSSDDIAVDKQPEASNSQSLFSHDSQSLASDVSGPVVGSGRMSTQGSDVSDAVIGSQSDASSNDQSEASSSSHHGKYYSIFSGKRRSARQAGKDSSPSTSGPLTSPKDCVVNKKVMARGDNKQLVLDAGQERFGATQCKECGMVYSHGDGDDEATHRRFHLSALIALKFTGWKKERVIKDFLEDGSRVILVMPDDQRFMVKKVEEVHRVMGQELGFYDQTFSFRGSYKVFLFISDEKRVEGCCIAESITQGYRILPSHGLADSQRSFCCSTVPVKAAVGIGRLWVYGPSRQQGIASRLVDCVRQWFEYGFLISKSQVAFSDPTSDGRMFAAKYTGTQSFLVYKYSHPTTP